MRLKTVWFTAFGVSALALMSASQICSATAQLWNPNVAQAAKLTAHLLKDKSIHPYLFARNSTARQIKAQPLSDKLGHADDILNYTLTQRLSLDYPVVQPTPSPAWLTAHQTTTRANEASEQLLHDLALEIQSTDFQNWHGSLNTTLIQQKYQLKKLEFELAQTQYKQGVINQATFEQKGANYRLAAQEFKQVLTSSKMAH